MAEGRSGALWQHTSHILALLANLHRDPKKTQPLRPADFDPHARPRGGAPVLATVRPRDLKAGFLRGGMVAQRFDPAWISRPPSGGEGR